MIVYLILIVFVILLAHQYYAKINSNYPKFYLAGKFTHKDTCNEKIQLLEDLGFINTWNWTQVEKHNVDHETMGYYAVKDIDGVVNADFLVVIIDDKDYAYRGTFTEIGAALAKKIPIYMFTPHDLDPTVPIYPRTNCFYCHPSINHFRRWNTLVDSVCKDFL